GALRNLNPVSQQASVTSCLRSLPEPHFRSIGMHKSLSVLRFFPVAALTLARGLLIFRRSGTKWEELGCWPRFPMFRGANKVTLDNKGRIAIPARYRERIREHSQGRLVVTVDREQCL